MKGIDPDIFKTVSHLQGIVHKKIKVDNDRLDELYRWTKNNLIESLIFRALSAAEKQDQISQLTMDGCPVEDLGLDFTLPGYPNIELRKGGR